MKIVRILLFTSILYLALSILAGYFLMEGALHPAKRPFREKTKQQFHSISSKLASRAETVAIRGSDQTKLAAWYLRSLQQSDRIVLLFHGLSDHRGGMLGYAPFLLKSQYNVLVPDWRGHGESEGEVATYGLNETADVSAWLDWAQDKQGHKNFYALGESYGAAILLQTLELENRICAAVAESSFCCFNKAAYDRLGGAVKIRNDTLKTMLFFPTIESAFLTARWKYEFDLKQINPRDSLRNSATPVLLIHGNEDTNIPVQHSRLMFAENQARTNLQFWEPEGAQHSATYGKMPREFESRVLEWFKKFDCSTNSKTK